MAQRRMFTREIIDSDAFTSMPPTAQNLYFHLGMMADDDGFINNARAIVYYSKASESDYQILLEKHFLIPFEKSDVVVIKHWLMNNQIRRDRYHPTNYQEEFKKLRIKDNGSYTLKKGNSLDFE